MKDVILKIDKVSYRYQDAAEDDYVLRNRSYTFEEGKVYAIKGKSGSGKTTLLSLLSGLEKNYEGSIQFDGRELRSLDLDSYRSRDIGIVFQSYNLLPSLTALENIILSMNISKVKVESKEKKAIELMKNVGLKESQKNRRVLKLSGGEQQRVAIARSLSYQPKMILADEPTGNLDKETENEILKILKNLAKKENKCVIIVTHSENVCSQADVVYELKKNIPMEAGLAGGSADGAAVLKAMNWMFHLGLTFKELAEIGKEVGADIPFCVYERMAVVKGIGEKLDFINSDFDCYVMLVKPKKGVSTPKAFQSLDLENAIHPYIEEIKEGIITNDYEKVVNHLGNTLEKPSIKMVKQIEEIKQDLLELGFDGALMSGSGSCVFGLTQNKEIMDKSYNTLKNKYFYVRKSKIYKK